MNKLIWVVISYFVLLGLAPVLRAQEDDDTDCLTKAEFVDEVKGDPHLTSLRPITDQHFLDRALALFYSQAELKDSKYFTIAFLVDRLDGGGMLFVGDGPDSICAFAIFTDDDWPVVIMWLEGVKI
jgi:hypothetical protein